MFMVYFIYLYFVDLINATKMEYVKVLFSL